MPLSETHIRRAVYAIVDSGTIFELRKMKRTYLVNEILDLEIQDRGTIRGQILESTSLSRMMGLSVTTLRARLLCLRSFKILRLLSADSADAILLLKVLQTDFHDEDFDFSKTQFMLLGLY